MFYFISQLFFLWRWVVTVSVPCRLTHVTVLSCQNYLETTNYEVLKNLEGFSLAFAPFHTKDPDPRRQHSTLYEHRAVMAFSSCAGVLKWHFFFFLHFTHFTKPATGSRRGSRHCQNILFVKKKAALKEKSTQKKQTMITPGWTQTVCH